MTIQRNSAFQSSTHPRPARIYKLTAILWKRLSILLTIALLLVACGGADDNITRSEILKTQAAIPTSQPPTEIPSATQQSPTDIVEPTATPAPPPVDLSGVPLFPAIEIVNQNMMMGYIDLTGRFVIPPQFWKTDYFYEDVAIVTVVEGYGRLIDKSGAFISEANLSSEYRPFSEGLAAVRSLENNLYGYIDLTGNFVIEPKFKSAGDFHDGHAIVTLTDDNKTYIDTQGNTILTPRYYPMMTNFNSGVAVVSQLISKDVALYGVINVQGEQLVPFEFSMIYEYSEGMAVARRGDNDSFGYLDTQGNFAIAPQFSSAFNFSEGRASVTLTTHGNCGYIDLTGQQVIPLQYIRCRPFSEGIAWVKQAEDTWLAIDLAGNQLFTLTANDVDEFKEGFARFSSATGMGFVNLSGEVVVPPAAAMIYQDFRDGLAAFTHMSTEGYFQGYIDQSGAIVYQVKP